MTAGSVLEGAILRSDCIVGPRNYTCDCCHPYLIVGLTKMNNHRRSLDLDREPIAFRE